MKLLSLSFAIVVVLLLLLLLVLFVVSLWVVFFVVVVGFLVVVVGFFVVVVVFFFVVVDFLVVLEIIKEVFAGIRVVVVIAVVLSWALLCKTPQKATANSSISQPIRHFFKSNNFIVL